MCLVLVTLVSQQPGDGHVPPGTPSPESVCIGLKVCDGSCALFPNGTWPVDSPVFPTDGGVTDVRRRLASPPSPPSSPASSAPSSSAAAALPAWVTLEGLRPALEAVAAAEAAAGGALGFYDAVALLAKAVVVGAVRDAGGAAALGLRAPRTTTTARAGVGNSTPPCSDGLDVACDISRVFDDHFPLVDHDGDAFPGEPRVNASEPEFGAFLSNHLRGADWRGRDCNDDLAGVYPGRAATAYGPEVDHNCNGIAGVEPASGTPYEALYCSGANAPMGVAILGDSATAHFHLPPQYVNARALNFSGLLQLAGNEAE